MSRYSQGTLIVSSSPHALDNITTSRIMMDVLIAMVPALIMSGVIFGPRAILLTIVCVVSSVVFEWGFEKITKRDNTISDLSAAVTGVLLSFNLPSNLPYWMAVLGCFVAIVIVKQLFGGIGQNFVNPAITARIVLLLSFATPMTTWPLPEQIMGASDAVTGPTPLGILNMGGNVADLPSNVDMFLGFVGGSLGETSAIALLLGGIYLVARKVIEPTIPVAFIGTVFIIALLAGEDAIFHVCAGGVMLGAFFMATDYSTSPLTTNGKIVFGIGCGLMTMIIRLFGSLPEGVSFSILLMNILTPHIDNLSRRKIYGGGGKKGGGK
jgi:electron transport complex protein RnfD